MGSHGLKGSVLATTKTKVPAVTSQAPDLIMIATTFSLMNFNEGHSPADTTLVSREWRSMPKHGKFLRITLQEGEEFRWAIATIRREWTQETLDGFTGLCLQGGPTDTPLEATERYPLNIMAIDYALEVLPLLQVLIFRDLWLVGDPTLPPPQTFSSKWKLHTLILRNVVIARYPVFGERFGLYSHSQILSRFKQIDRLVVEGAVTADQDELDKANDEVVKRFGRGNSIASSPVIKEVIIQDGKCSRLLYGFLSRSCSKYITNLRLAITNKRELGMLRKLLSYTYNARELALDISRCHDGVYSRLGLSVLPIVTANDGSSDLLSGPGELVWAISNSQRHDNPMNQKLEVVSISIFVDTHPGSDDIVNGDARRCLESVIRVMNKSVRKLQIEFVHTSAHASALACYIQSQAWTSLKRHLRVCCEEKGLELVRFTACNCSGSARDEWAMSLDTAARCALRSAFEHIVPNLSFQ